MSNLIFRPQLHGSDVNPDFDARDRSLEILRQSTVSIEPSKGSFNDPSARQQLKADGVNGAFDDFDGPVTEFGEGITQTGAGLPTGPSALWTEKDDRTFSLALAIFDPRPRRVSEPHS